MYRCSKCGNRARLNDFDDVRISDSHIEGTCRICSNHIELYQEEADFDCSLCGYSDSLDKFDEIDYDGEVMGNCPACGARCRLIPFMEEDDELYEPADTEVPTT